MKERIVIRTPFIGVHDCETGVCWMKKTVYEGEMLACIVPTPDIG